MDINATLLGQMITFALFVWFTMKFVWPPLEKALAVRRENIVEGLAQAEKGRKSLDDAAVLIAEQLKQSRQQASTIIEEAHKRANLIVEEAKKQAQAEQSLEVQKAKAEIEQLGYAAKEQLKNEVVAISVLATKRLINKNLNDKDQESLLSDLVAQL